MADGVAVRLVRVGLAVAIASFVGYFAITAYGDLFPLEPFGAEFLTTPPTTTIRRVTPAGAADRAGIRVGDQIQTIEGRPVRNALDWASVFARVAEGRAVPVTLVRGGRVEQLDIVFQRNSVAPWQNQQGVILLIARLAQLVTLIFAIAIVVRSTDRSALLGFWLLATISIYTVGLPPRMAVIWTQLPAPIRFLLYLPSISKAVIGLILFAFFRTLVNATMTRRTAAMLVPPFVALAVWDVVFLTALLHQPRMIPRLTGLLPFVIAVNFAYLVGALVVMVVHYRTLDNPSERRRFRWIAAGSILGCAAGAPTVAGLWLGISNDPVLIYHSPLGFQLGYTAFLVMPASFWWAIARGELFDIKFVMRRGLQYVFARRGLVIITPVVVGALALEAMVHEDEPLRQILRTHAALYVVAAAGLLIFRTRRASWLASLDRRLFRERYDACQLLREVAAQIRTTADLKTAADCAVMQIGAALHPEWLVVYGCGPTDGHFQYLAGDAVDLAWPRRARLVEELRAHRLPTEISAHRDAWLQQQLAAGDIEPLRRARARLIVPAFHSDGMDVLFVLGTKRSGEPYSQEDKNLVQAVAESVGHLANTVVSRQDERSMSGRDSAEASWDQHLWNLADAVATGSRVDWGQESTDIVGDERRQVLLELQALERLMQVHGATADASALEQVPAFDRWGSFELRERIGAGRFGSVYRAWDPKLEREVAIKLLNVGGIDRAAYLREARHLARVRHPSVVHVYGADEFDDTPGFWMELVEGRTLSDLLREHGPFDVLDAAAIATALCGALSAIHRAGLVHQDVKAQNVMRERDGRLVLMDLGAGTREAGRPLWGTPSYMSPELFRGGCASARSDLYSLGVLLFFLTTGAFPVEGTSYEDLAEQHGRGRSRRLRELRPDLPPTFLDAVDRVLAPDPALRYGGVDEFGAAIAMAGV